MSQAVAFCWLSLNRCGGSRFSLFLVVFCTLRNIEPLSFLRYRLKNGKQVWKIFDTISRLILCAFLGFFSTSWLTLANHAPLLETYANWYEALPEKICFIHFVDTKPLNQKPDHKTISSFLLALLSRLQVARIPNIIRYYIKNKTFLYNIQHSPFRLAACAWLSLNAETTCRDYSQEKD